jgi:cytochrome c6
LDLILEDLIMKKTLIASFAMIAVCSFATAGMADIKKGEKIDGKKEFTEHCAVCHPKGGNVINAAKTLGRKELEANGIKSARDIIAKMRKPGPGMTQFDKKTIPDSEAKAIAEYILKTFK